MKAEVRSISSIKLVPENDSDRAVLQAFVDQSQNKSLMFHVQSYCYEDSKLIDLVAGFASAPVNIAAREALEAARQCVHDSSVEEMIDAALKSL
jgi:hypothetical protein